MSILDKNIFILTGAGISKESGIETFREKDGLWDNYRIEDVCTIQAFQKNPDFVNNFYNERKKKLERPDILPNEAHKSLVKLEKNCRGNFLIVTQNIDNLHEKAGTKKILHMHGTMNKVYCMYCKHVETFDFELSSNYVCKNCRNKGKVRVDVVWFGEQPKYLDKIYSFLENVDIFISIGTSNNVYPAAGFIDFSNQLQKKIEFYEFNIEITNKSSLFDKRFIGPASETLPKFVDDVISF
mgnify:CR=1 FL=1